MTDRDEAIINFGANTLRASGQYRDVASLYGAAPADKSESAFVGVDLRGSDITADVELTIGPNTWPVNGYGLIATAGGIDSHVHLITPRLVPVALSAGITTLITAGFEEPPYAMDKTLRAFEFLPVNLGLQASARTDVPGQVERVARIHRELGRLAGIQPRSKK